MQKLSKLLRNFKPFFSKIEVIISTFLCISNKTYSLQKSVSLTLASFLEKSGPWHQLHPNFTGVIGKKTQNFTNAENENCYGSKSSFFKNLSLQMMPAFQSDNFKLV